MIDYLKDNKFSIFLIFLTFILAGVAFGIAYQIYNSTSTAPTDTSAGSTENTTESCSAVLLTVATPDPSPSATASATATATATAEPVYSCNSSCDTDEQCQSADSSYICSEQTNTCRHKDWPDESDCMEPEEENSPTATATPTPTEAPTESPSEIATSTPVAVQTKQPELPDAGVGLPTILGVGFAIILLGLSAMLAL